MKSNLDAVAGFLVQQSWQIPIVVGLVVLACWVFRNATAHWRYPLWIVVIAKCLMPPLVNLPLPVLPVDDRKVPLSSAVHVTASNDEITFDASIADIAQPSTPITEETNSVATQSVAASSAARAHIPLPPEKFSLRHWLVIGWLLIVGILIVRTAGRMWSTSRRLKSTTQPADDDIHFDVAAIAKALGMKKAPAVRMTDTIAQPFVWGWLRGDVYLPFSFSDMGTVDQRHAILTHELAHVHRWDAALNHLQNFVQALFFFHPLIWWTNQKIRQEREKCCDEIVLSTSNVQPKIYCEAIVGMLALEYASHQATPALAVTGSIKNVKERITTMLSPNRRFHRSPSRAAVITVLLVAACVLPTAVVMAPRTGNAAAQDGLPDSATKSIANETESKAGENVSPLDFKVSAAEFASAADTLRSEGGFVRTFYERGSPKHWVQIILESRAPGVLPSFVPVDETKSPVFTDEDLTTVRRLTLDSPAQVHLRGGTFSANGISLLDATKIWRLEFSGCPFDDAMAAELSKLTHLEELSFDNSQLTALGIEELSKCTHLKNIGFDDEVSFPEIEILPQLPILEAVSIRAPLNERAVSLLNACDGIKSMTLRITDSQASQAFTALSGLESLSKVDLSGDGITEELIVSLTRKSRSLKELYLRNHQGATLPAMNAIAELPMLEVLSLDGSNVTDNGIVALKEVPNLRWLDISNTEVTDRCLIAIGNMPKMGMLDLMSTNVSSSGLDRLSRLTELRRLNVEGTYVQTIPDWMRDRPRLTVSYDENQRKPARIPPVAELNSLTHAVEEFNARAGKNSIGKFEPALTTDEIVAAIRAWNRQQMPVDDATFKIFQNIANNLQLPEGSSLGFNTGWENKGIRFQAWWINLVVMTGENAGYGFRIRERIISSSELPK